MSTKKYRQPEYVFNTVYEKELAYKTTKNELLAEIDKIFEEEETVLEYSFEHKLKHKIMLLFKLRKMQFGAYLIFIAVPLLYIGFALYTIINPFDTMTITDSNNFTEQVHFNEGALMFGSLLQIAMWGLMITHGVLGVVYIRKDAELAVDVLDSLIFPTLLPLMVLFFIFSIIRITVYTVGMEEYLEHKTQEIDRTHRLRIEDERDITLGPNESLSSIRWINLKFIFPGIIFPIITFYLIIFLAHIVIAGLNYIHLLKIKDRDDYIKTLYYSEKVKEFLNKKSGSASSEDFNWRDGQFDINSEVSEKVRNFEKEIIKETLRESNPNVTDAEMVRESLQVTSPAHGNLFISNNSGIYRLFPNTVGSTPSPGTFEKATQPVFDRESSSEEIKIQQNLLATKTEAVSAFIKSADYVKQNPYSELEIVESENCLNNSF